MYNSLCDCLSNKFIFMISSGLLWNNIMLSYKLSSIVPFKLAINEDWDMIVSININVWLLLLLLLLFWLFKALIPSIKLFLYVLVVYMSKQIDIHIRVGFHISLINFIQWRYLFNEFNVSGNLYNGIIIFSDLDCVIASVKPE